MRWEVIRHLLAGDFPTIARVRADDLPLAHPLSVSDLGSEESGKKYAICKWKKHAI
jgi:hypothetical protein